MFCDTKFVTPFKLTQVDVFNIINIKDPLELTTDLSEDEPDLTETTDSLPDAED